MKVEKEERKVVIVCSDGTFIRGSIHINPGERVIDFLNDTKENFIAVTNAEFRNVRRVHFFKLHSGLMKKDGTALLLKNAIKWVEES